MFICWQNRWFFSLLFFFFNSRPTRTSSPWRTQKIFSARGRHDTNARDVDAAVKSSATVNVSKRWLSILPWKFRFSLASSPRPTSRPKTFRTQLSGASAATSGVRRPACCQSSQRRWSQQFGGWRTTGVQTERFEWDIFGNEISKKQTNGARNLNCSIWIAATAGYKTSIATSTSPVAVPTDAVTQLSTSQYYLASRDANNDDVNEAAARLLFLAVRWARTIPSFSNVKFDFKDGCMLSSFEHTNFKTNLYLLSWFICTSFNEMHNSEIDFYSCLTETNVFCWRRPGASCLF